MIISINDLEDTKKFASYLAENLHLQDCICFYGDLGAGKTSFIRFLVEAFYKKHGYEAPNVTSPTFALVHLYEKSPIHIAHFDMYRLKTSHEVETIGFDEYIEDYICLIEWASKIEEYLPENRLDLFFSLKDEKRSIEIRPQGNYPFLSVSYLK